MNEHAKAVQVSPPSPSLASFPNTQLIRKASLVLVQKIRLRTGIASSEMQELKLYHGQYNLSNQIAHSEVYKSLIHPALRLYLYTPPCISYTPYLYHLLSSPPTLDQQPLQIHVRVWWPIRADHQLMDNTTTLLDCYIHPSAYANICSWLTTRHNGGSRIKDARRRSINTGSQFSIRKLGIMQDARHDHTH